MIIYDIGDNRWCGNIKRQHKSNHIYYIADLKFSHIYQKCHDFECTHYRSPETPIPSEINPILEKTTGVNESTDRELNQLFEEDIDFIGKRSKQSEPDQETYQEIFFEDEDEVLDDEILKLSTTTYAQLLPAAKQQESRYFSDSSDELFLEEPLCLNQSLTNSTNNLNSLSCHDKDDGEDALDGSADLFDELVCPANSSTSQDRSQQKVEENCTSTPRVMTNISQHVNNNNNLPFYHDEQFDTTKVKSIMDYSVNTTGDLLTAEEDSVLNAIFNEENEISLSDFI